MESRINDRRALNSELGVVNTAALVGLRNGVAPFVSKLTYQRGDALLP